MKPMRMVYLLILLAGVAAILYPNFRHIRRVHQVKQTLQTIQTALQNYHVKREVYVDETPIPGARLIEILIESGFMESPPRNPYTGKSYALDGKEVDRIEYSTSETLKTYSLRALHFDRDETFLILDSTEHHSLD